MLSPGHNVTAVHMMSQCCGHSHKTCRRWGARHGLGAQEAPPPKPVNDYRGRGTLVFQQNSHFRFLVLQQIPSTRAHARGCNQWITNRERTECRVEQRKVLWEGCERRSYSHAIVRRLKVILNVFKSVLQNVMLIKAQHFSFRSLQL